MPSKAVKSDCLKESAIALTKGKVYHLKSVDVPTLDNDAGKDITFVSSPDLSQLSLFGENEEFDSKNPDLNVESPDFDSKIPELSFESPDLNIESPDLDEEKQLWQELLEIASPIRNGAYRAKRNDIEKVIIQLCEKSDQKYLGLADIAKLLGRNTDTLRKSYLSPMLKNQQLTLAYPTTPNHPNQGYKIKKES